jgi:iron(III) transport system ATP-binding protein
MAVPVTISRLTKSFDAFKALKEVSLQVEPGELFFLLGPSGCGKTTLLRCLAGFLTPDTGTLAIGDTDVTKLPPHRRNTGMVFQQYALWPHLTLAQNIAFGLEMRKVARPEIQQRVREALALVRLEDRAKDKPGQLSGGQQQRVALARALVVKPQCLLLDEPLSNLDATLRLEMRAEIRRICKQAGLTALYVTHDQKEALSIADRIAVMREGVIEQLGTPEQIYRSPANRFVAGFIGEANFITGTVRSFTETTLTLETACGIFVAKKAQHAFKPGDAVELCIRPEHIRFDTPVSDLPNRLNGHFAESTYLGDVTQHLLALPGAHGQPVLLKALELNPLPGRTRQGAPVTAWIEQQHVTLTTPS